MSVAWLISEYDSAKLSSYLFIDPFILICNLAFTRLYTYRAILRQIEIKHT